MADIATGPGPFAARRFTIEEYHRMAEAGILSPAERVELIRGAVREMSPKNRAHVIASTRVFALLLKKLDGRATVYVEAPLRLESLDSEPEPDVMVCSNVDVEAYGTEATTPLLIVEVADSSLRRDLGDKAPLYAEAQIPEYWVVNLVDRVLVVFREPRDGNYSSRSTMELSGRVAPEAWPDLEVEVAALFPNESLDAE